MREHTPVRTQTVLLNEISYTRQFLLNVLKRRDFLLGFFEIQAVGVVRIELFDFCTFGIAFLKEFVIVETSVVRRHTIEITHILCLCALFLCQQCLVHLLAMANADNLDIFLLTTKELA